MIIPSVRWREFVAIDLTRRDDYISPRTRRGAAHTQSWPGHQSAVWAGSRLHGQVTHFLPYIRVPKRPACETRVHPIRGCNGGRRSGRAFDPPLGWWRRAASGRRSPLHPRIAPTHDHSQKRRRKCSRATNSRSGVHDAAAGIADRASGGPSLEHADGIRGRGWCVAQRRIQTATATIPLWCGCIAATVPTRTWTVEPSPASIKHWSMSASSATIGSDGCCTTTSPG
jgi:hypothetical protein